MGSNASLCYRRSCTHQNIYSQTYSDNINFVLGRRRFCKHIGRRRRRLVGSLEEALNRRSRNNWSLKAEYLYVRFDGLSVTEPHLTNPLPQRSAPSLSSQTVLTFRQILSVLDSIINLAPFGARNTRDRLADVGVVKKPVTSSKPSRTATIRSALLPRPQRHRARAGINRSVIRAQECECGVVVLYYMNIIAGELRERRVV